MGSGGAQGVLRLSYSSLVLPVSVVLYRASSTVHLNVCALVSPTPQCRCAIFVFLQVTPGTGRFIPLKTFGPMYENYEQRDVTQVGPTFAHGSLAHISCDQLAA